MGIRTKNEELRSMRTVQRELSSIVSDLESGKLEKVVVTRHGKMVAVITTADNYESLVDAAPDR